MDLKNNHPQDSTATEDLMSFIDRKIIGGSNPPKKLELELSDGELKDEIKNTIVTECLKAIYDYDLFIKSELDKTFDPIKDSGMHSVFCVQMSDVREKFASRYYCL